MRTAPLLRCWPHGLALDDLDLGHPLNATPATDLTAAYRWSTDLAAFCIDGEANGAGTTTVNFSHGAASGGMVTVTANMTGTVITIENPIEDRRRQVGGDGFHDAPLMPT